MTDERTLYWHKSFHPQKVGLALNTLELPHKVHRVDLLAREQQTPEFLAMNPMGKVPSWSTMAWPCRRRARSSPISASVTGCGRPTRAEALRWLFVEAHGVRDPVGDVWFNRFFMPLVDGPLNL